MFPMMGKGQPGSRHDAIAGEGAGISPVPGVKYTNGARFHSKMDVPGSPYRSMHRRTTG